MDLNDLKKFAETFDELITKEKAAKRKAKDADNGDNMDKSISSMLDRLRSQRSYTDDTPIKRGATDNKLYNTEPNPEDLIKRIKGILKKPKEHRPKVITSLFHGAPGTGKSSLALDICNALNIKPILASYADIQSMYVGEGEKNLKRLFNEARREGKALILDECDALMINRETAQKEWNKSMTNQFLTELDKHRGLFFATTNFVDTLDAAVLRRLFLKMEFNWLTDEQLVYAFKYFFNKRVYLKDVASLSHLTPGDFHAVRERALYEPTVPTVADYKRLLMQEVEYKQKTMATVRDDMAPKIGF